MYLIRKNFPSTLWLTKLLKILQKLQPSLPTDHDFTIICAGLSFGVYLGFTLLIMLMSETFWNKWRSSPQSDGIVSLQGRL